LTLLFEFGDVGRRQLTRLPRHPAVPKPFARTLGGGGFRPTRAVRTEIPTGLQGAATVWTAAALTFSAMRTRHKIDADRRAASHAKRTDFANLGDHPQQLFGCRDATLHFRESVFAEAHHAAGNGRVADLRLGGARRDRSTQLVGHAHHFVDPDA